MRKLLVLLAVTISSAFAQVGTLPNASSTTGVSSIAGDSHISPSSSTGAVTLTFIPANNDYSFSMISGLLATSQLPANAGRWTSGAGAPVGNCTAAQDFYLDTTLFDSWYCSATNTWRKILNTTNSGVFALTGVYGSDPCGTVSAGSACISINSSQALTIKHSDNSITDYTNPSQLSGTAAATVKAHSFGCTFDGAGSAITNGSTCYVTDDIPFACTIGGYSLGADTGTFTVKFWKIATGTARPTVSNVINTSGLALSSGTMLRSTTTSDFTTTTVTAHDAIAVNITAISGPTKLSAAVECNQ